MTNSGFGQEGVIYGSISSPINLRGRVSISSDREYYSGNYHVAPKTNSQILSTLDKVMAENIVVEAIPYVETENSEGGIAVTIG